MSVCLFHYSPSAIIPHRTEVRAGLASQGWHLLFVSNWWNLTIADEGEVDQDLIIGCKKTEGITELSDLFARNDRTDIENLLATKPFGNCGISIDKSVILDETEVKKRSKRWSTEAIASLRAAKVLYYVEFKGASTANSGNLAGDLWRLLGKMFGGLLEDPQTGRATVVAAGNSE